MSWLHLHACFTQSATNFDGNQADGHFVCACSSEKHSNTSLAPFCSVERAVQFHKWTIDASETLSLQNVKGSNIFTKDPIPECIYSFCCHFGWRDFSDQSVNKMPAILALREMLGLIHLFQLYASPIDKTILANGIV